MNKSSPLLSNTPCFFSVIFNIISPGKPSKTWSLSNSYLTWCPLGIPLSTSTSRVTCFVASFFPEQVAHLFLTKLPFPPHLSQCDCYCMVLYPICWVLITMPFPPHLSHLWVCPSLDPDPLHLVQITCLLYWNLSSLPP